MILKSTFSFSLLIDVTFFTFHLDMAAEKLQSLVPSWQALDLYYHPFVNVWSYCISPLESLPALDSPFVTSPPWSSSPTISTKIGLLQPEFRFAGPAWELSFLLR